MNHTSQSTPYDYITTSYDLSPRVYIPNDNDMAWMLQAEPRAQGTLDQDCFLTIIECRFG
jgi:hypothetical protein